MEASYVLHDDEETSSASASPLPPGWTPSSYSADGYTPFIMLNTLSEENMAVYQLDAQDDESGAPSPSGPSSLLFALLSPLRSAY